MSSFAGQDADGKPLNLMEAVEFLTTPGVAGTAEEMRRGYMKDVLNLSAQDIEDAFRMAGQAVTQLSRSAAPPAPVPSINNQNAADDDTRKAQAAASAYAVAEAAVMQIVAEQAAEQVAEQALSGRGCDYGQAPDPEEKELEAPRMPRRAPAASRPAVGVHSPAPTQPRANLVECLEGAPQDPSGRGCDYGQAPEDPNRP